MKIVIDPPIAVTESNVRFYLFCHQGNLMHLLGGDPSKCLYFAKEYQEVSQLILTPRQVVSIRSSGWYPER